MVGYETLCEPVPCCHYDHDPPGIRMLVGTAHQLLRRLGSAAIAALASYGHSGGSMSVAIEQLHTLLQFRTLSPLTSDPNEWRDRSPESNSPLWQNRRDPAAFSKDGGAAWYFC